MAAPLNKKSIRSLPTVPYAQIRSELVTGDVVFCSGNYLFSGIIQQLTKSNWSHVAVVYKDENLGRVLLLEAEPSVGIRLIPLSNYLRNYRATGRPYKGEMMVCRFHEPWTTDKLNRGISFGLDQLTRPYDNKEIVRIMIRILFKISKRERNKSYICSELVRDMLAKAGVVIQYNDTYISPDHIWKDDRLTTLYRIL